MNFHWTASRFVAVIALTFILSNSTSGLAQEIKTDEEENKFLSIVLKQYKGKGFNVVHPKTIGPASFSGGIRKAMQNSLKLPDGKSSFLIDAFLKKNRQSAIISLKSNKEKGYVIDYDSSKPERRFFDKFLLLRKKGKVYAGADLAIRISRPLYDKSTGVVLIYVDWLGGSHYSESEVIQFRYQGGKLTRVDSIVLWVS